MKNCCMLIMFGQHLLFLLGQQFRSSWAVKVVTAETNHIALVNPINRTLVHFSIAQTPALDCSRRPQHLCDGLYTITLFSLFIQCFCQWDQPILETPLISATFGHQGCVCRVDWDEKILYLIENLYGCNPPGREVCKGMQCS